MSNLGKSGNELLKNIKNLSALVDNSWVQVVEKIANNDPSLTEVVLAHQSLEEKGAIALASALKNNTVITSLKIGGNNFQDAGSKKILDAIFSNSNPTITSLDISFNGISSSGIDYLVTKLSSNKHSITTLVTIGNSVDDSQQEEIVMLTGDGGLSLTATSNEKRKRKTRRDKDKDKDKDKRRKTDKTKRRTKKSSSSSDAPTIDIGDVRVSLLEKQIVELMSSEKDYLSHIEMLESKLEKISSGGEKKKFSFLPSKKEKVKKYTIALGNPIVTHKLATTGGSNAGVYSCIVDGWQCAMKELDLSDMDEFTIRNFEGEIRILELLPPHENIARYLFHEVKDNKLRLFMTQYGSSLGSQISKYKKEGKVFSPMAISTYLVDIIKGIEFLHLQGIVHRDLKSDNVFVLLDDKNQIISCAIGDFDTAKQIIGVKAQKAMTVLGTPSWMAPEVMNARDCGEYGLACDIYSFGMVLYELLSQKIPYEDMNPMQVPLLVTQGKKPPLPSLGDEYSSLVELYERCTVFDPAKRPSSSSVKQTVSMLLATLKIS